MANQIKDIEADITFLSTEVGGRRGPAYPGYRPQFYYDGGGWDAVLDWDSLAPAMPGQTVRVFVSFLHPTSHVGRLYVGKEFSLREGAHFVAQGRVTRILGLATAGDWSRASTSADPTPDVDG
jgi:elongation factor Tu